MKILDSLFKRRLIWIAIIFAFFYVSCSGVDGIVSSLHSWLLTVTTVNYVL